MQKVLVLANQAASLYNLRKELLEALLAVPYEVYVALPNGDKVEELKRLGCKVLLHDVDRRGKNVMKDGVLLFQYNKILKNVQPHLVIGYTIKPNIYGGLLCRRQQIPFIANVTGLGSGLERDGVMQNILTRLYCLAKIPSIFFQNERNYRFFEERKIIKGRFQMVPGSGVRLEHFSSVAYPLEDEVLRFLFIGRLMREKGVEELVEAAIMIRKRYAHVVFDVVGAPEPEFEARWEELLTLDAVNYVSSVEDVRPFIARSHAVVLPSYHEGMANVLLEAAAMGRPVLASAIAGCQETLEEGVTGFSFAARDTNALVDRLEAFIHLPYEDKRRMGMLGREKMEQEFDREKVVQTYLQEIRYMINSPRELDAAFKVVNDKS